VLSITLLYYLPIVVYVHVVEANGKVWKGRQLQSRQGRRPLTVPGGAVTSITPRQVLVEYTELEDHKKTVISFGFRDRARLRLRTDVLLAQRRFPYRP